MYRPVNDCFKKSDKIRAQHELFEDFKQERTDIAKFHFYLWLQKNELKADYGKDEKGNIGYGLEYIGTCECETPYFPAGNTKHCSKCDKPTVY